MAGDNLNSAASSPLVTVVIPCRNEVKHIRQCVASLLQQSPVAGGFEIIIADGMSDDGTREVLHAMTREHPQVIVVDNPAKVTACGMNAGIRAARGEWIAILGAHNRYAPDYLERCLETARQTGADNIGGAMFCEGKHYMQRAIAAAHHSPFAVGNASWHNPHFEGPVDTVFGGFYKREVFDRIGLFDESLVRNQDDELNLRLVRAGGRIWHSPRIRSWYHPRSSLRALFNQYMQYGYWKVRVIQKHKLPASWRHLVPGAFVLTLLSLILLSTFSFLLSALTTDHRQLTTDLCRLSSGLLALALAAYALALITASLITTAKAGWALLPALPFVFPCYHFGYGWGFLRGVWDFVIRRRGAQKHFEVLTR
jgi:glycosyltransferase involved in cell wall biosynthesis